MDETKNEVDPFCGSATYDGHKGTDIRLRTLVDTKNNVEVLAAANGTIKAVRNKIPDNLIVTNQDRGAVKTLNAAMAL